jgi:glycerol-3-phosphate acyltransferase PlsY
LGLSALGAAFVILLHHANIRRLLAGTEQKAGSAQRGKKP